MKPFALVATQRSGTNFFRSVVNQHPQIHCCDELFLDNGWQDDSFNFYHYWLQRIAKEPQLITSRGSATAIAGFMNAVFASFPNAQAVGIDIKYTELERLFHLSNVILARKWPVIHIVRRNVLKAQISHFLLNVRKGLLPPSDYKGCMEAVDEKRVRIEPNDELIDLLTTASDEISRWRKRFKAGPYLEIAYEDFFPPGQASAATIQPQVLKRVFTFLDVREIKPDALVSQRKKGNPSNLRQLIDNFEEVAESLQGTRWGEFLCSQ